MSSDWSHEKEMIEALENVKKARTGVENEGSGEATSSGEENSTESDSVTAPIKYAMTFKIAKKLKGGQIIGTFEYNADSRKQAKRKAREVFGKRGVCWIA